MQTNKCGVRYTGKGTLRQKGKLTTESASWISLELFFGWDLTVLETYMYVNNENGVTVFCKLHQAKDGEKKRLHLSFCCKFQTEYLFCVIFVSGTILAYFSQMSYMVSSFIVYSTKEMKTEERKVFIPSYFNKLVGSGTEPNLSHLYYNSSRHTICAIISVLWNRSFPFY